jgi:NADH:ubiquinone oxidoreductase subunit 4 (subunit M)
MDFAPLVVMTLLGVYPALILDVIGRLVAALLKTMTRLLPQRRLYAIRRSRIGRERHD